MIKSKSYLTLEHYVAPVCELFPVVMTGVLCESPMFGDSNEAGSAVEVEQTFDF